MGKQGNKIRQSRRIKKADKITPEQAADLAASISSETSDIVELISNLPVVVDGNVHVNPILAQPYDDGSSFDEPFDDGLSSSAMADDVPKHRITVMQDHTLEYPELYMEIFLVGKDGGSDALFAQLFARASCKKAKSMAEADLVVFVGGPDVNPALYGAEKHNQTYYYDDRDTDDINAYMFCMENGIPMLGVCRGAQFLHVMNGGKLYQHVDNHYGDHTMIDIETKVMIEKVSSVHHQMVIPHTDMKIIATANKARNRFRNPLDNDMGTRADIEAFFYKDTCCLGIQGHPEYRGYNFFAIWSLNLLQKYVIENTDLDWAEGTRFRRMKPELVETRLERASGVLATVSRGVN